MSKYKIVFKDKTKQPILNLSLNKAIDYRVANIETANEFEVEEMVQNSKEPKTKENEFTPERRSKFMKTLSQMQRDEIRAGLKKVVHTEDGGFMVKVIHKDNPFYSVMEARAKRKEILGKRLRDYIVDQSPYIIQELSDEEDDKTMISELIEESFCD